MPRKCLNRSKIEGITQRTGLGKKVCEADAKTRKSREIELDLMEDSTLVKKKS